MKQVLRLEHVEKKFHNHLAVSDLSFGLNSGEVLGIIGQNGAGKTTTIKMILGLLQPTSGTIELFNSSISQSNVRSRIGYMPESPRFFSYLQGQELLTFVGQLFSLSKKESTIRAAQLLEQVGLTSAAKKRIGDYSKGMLQRIALAQALINKPELLFLDEPLDGLDPLGRIQMKEILQSIQSEGTAIVLSSHILSDVAQVCDTIAILDHGKLLTHKPTKELLATNSSLEEVFLNTITHATH